MYPPCASTGELQTTSKEVDAVIEVTLHEILETRQLSTVFPPTVATHFGVRIIELVAPTHVAGTVVVLLSEVDNPPLPNVVVNVPKFPELDETAQTVIPPESEHVIDDPVKFTVVLCVRDAPSSWIVEYPPPEELGGVPGENPPANAAAEYVRINKINFFISSIRTDKPIVFQRQQYSQ